MPVRWPAPDLAPRWGRMRGLNKGLKSSGSAILTDRYSGEKGLIDLSKTNFNECEYRHCKNYSASPHCGSEKSPFSEMKVALTAQT
jgi:hypothetical protein